MSPKPIPADPEACYLALVARDARFGGCFFTGVSSTGIYCRPVCRVRTPKRENCHFFALAAQAEQAGFRPCLRCRPELAPRPPGVGIGTAVRAWSIQDASAILAVQAVRLLEQPEVWGDSAPGVRTLAQRLGVSDRHLRRIFENQLGVSPLQYLQTRRLLCAKQLLTDTSLPVSQIASMSGFSSLRRFNAAFAEHYQLNPSQLRRSGAQPGPQPRTPGIHLRLAYRPPYDVDALLQFFDARAIAGLEQIGREPAAPCLARTIALHDGRQLCRGWLLARFDQAQHRVELQVSDSLATTLPQLLTRVRALLDLDADPLAINRQLHNSFPTGDGLRVPGCLDGFELAVRAVLGQQVTVAAARTLGSRLVESFGEPLETPLAGLSRLFPSPAALAHASEDALGQLGIVRQRQAAIQALARAVLQGQLALHAGADAPATVARLQTLPGIGDWTAQYIAMRALRWPDAFAAGDVALHRALGLQAAKHPSREALVLARAWQPWRSYALIRAWAALPAPRRGRTASASTPSRPSRKQAA